MANMTELSRQMVNDAFRAKTTAEAIALLRENARFRTLKDVLLAADPAHSSEKELKKKLAEGLCRHHPEKKPDSLSRNVSNWFAGRVRTISKETAFELCLILGLSLEEANHLVMRISEEAIHWRNPEEIVWGYAIVHRLSYADTMSLMAAVREKSLVSARPESGKIFTHLIRSEVLAHLRGSKQELLAYIAENAEKWGSFHNTAYDLFTRFMLLLQTGASDPDELEQKKLEKAKKKSKDVDGLDETMTAEDVLDTYFFRKCVETGGEMSPLQRSIRMNWPDSATLARMRQRSDGTDVSRKVLVLLFLATNGHASEFQIDDEEEYDERRTRDRAFRDLYIRLNRMLSRCGFQPLDPRSPFDWMILFCICARDIWDTDRRLEEVLSGLFPDAEMDGKAAQSE